MIKVDDLKRTVKIAVYTKYNPGERPSFRILMLLKMALVDFG